MKNKRYGAVFVACAAIILAGCAPDPSTSDTSTSSSQESSLPSSIGSEGSDSSSMSAGGTSTASEPESSTPGTSVYVDPMMLFDEALKKDYSNQTLRYDANVDGSDIALLYVYSFDGYQAVYDYNMALSGYDYEDCFLFYHDYEGESRLFFEDEGHGDAWLAYGYHDAPLGIENTYFNTPEFLDVVKALKHEDITYAPMGLPIYYVLDEEKVAETAGEFFGFFGFELSNVAYYGFTINDDGYIDSLIAFDDWGDNANYVSVQWTNFGTTAAPEYVTVPAAPTAETAMTYAEYKGEEPWVEVPLTSIAIAPAEGEDLSLEFDETLVIDCTVLPENANNYTLSPVSDNEAVATFDWGYDGKLYVTALAAGTAKIHVEDVSTGIKSNELTITVVDSEVPARTDVIDDLFFNSMDETTGEIDLYDALEDGKTPELKANDPEAAYLTYVQSTYDNPLDFDTEQALIMQAGNAWDHCDTGFTIAYPEGEGADGIAFRYGLPFIAHEANVDWLTSVKTEVSDDGETWQLADDWTEEYKTRVSGSNMKLYEHDFDKAYRYIRVSFDYGFVGKPLWTAVQNIKLFLKA